MPNAVKKACQRCGAAHDNKGAHCSACSPTANTAQNSERDNSVRKLYGSVTWRRFSPMMLRLNPICCKLVLDCRTGNMEQCLYPAKVVHHIISPRQDPAKMFNPRNVVPLCEGCHPAGVDGTPMWREGVEYVPVVQPKHSC